MQTAGITTTDILAVIGAITGIIGTFAGLGALSWDFYKWRYSERVRLRVMATPGFVTTTDPSTEYVHVAVYNVGRMRTTIKAISLHGFDNKKELKKRNGKKIRIVWNPSYGQLPAILEPGDDWACGLLQSSINKEYLQFEYFIVQIDDTMSEFPFRAQVDKKLLSK